MGQSLERYIKQIIHQVLFTGEWTQIHVVGAIRRPPRAIAADWEKPNRPFDSQRPTAVMTDGIVHLNCVPSNIYIQHYASVVATFLSMTNKYCKLVKPIPSAPSDLLTCFAQSNLPDLGPVDIVIVGQDPRLSSLTDWKWPLAESSERDLFVWQRYVTDRGKTVALLECKESIWGETGGRTLYLLQRVSGIKCAVYVSKTGALSGDYSPNECIATGEESYLGAEKIWWISVLDSSLHLSEKVIAGRQVTVPSSLCETREWLQDWQTTCSWVDCETGHMAKAANELGLDFGYLHVVSDNLAKKYQDDLSNEDVESEFSKGQLA